MKKGEMALNFVLRFCLLIQERVYAWKTPRKSFIYLKKLQQSSTDMEVSRRLFAFYGLCTTFPQ